MKFEYATGGPVEMEVIDDMIVVRFDYEAASQILLVDAIREAARMFPGNPIPYNPDAAFLKRARGSSLGAPLTVEADIVHDEQRYRLQGYAMKILYAEVGPEGEWLGAPSVEVAW